MEKENKYFTPDIEDIRVGYECEICPNLGYDDVWIKTTGHCEEIVGNGVKSCNLDELTYDCLVDGYIGIRTPYLTKEQIEGEGYLIIKNREDGFDAQKHYTKYNFTELNYEYYNNELIIDEYYQSELVATPTGVFNSYTIFKGVCKDINTFRYIIKLLGI